MSVGSRRRTQPHLRLRPPSPERAAWSARVTDTRDPMHSEWTNEMTRSTVDLRVPLRIPPRVGQFIAPASIHGSPGCNGLVTSFKAFHWAVPRKGGRARTSGVAMEDRDPLRLSLHGYVHTPTLWMDLHVAPTRSKAGEVDGTTRPRMTNEHDTSTMRAHPPATTRATQATNHQFQWTKQRRTARQALGDVPTDAKRPAHAAADAALWRTEPPDSPSGQPF